MVYHEQPRRQVETGFEFYSLGIPGIPFLTSGERLLLSPLAQEKLTGKTGPVVKEQFSQHPISNLVFHQSESGEWQNGSWIVDIDGFDQKMFGFLSQPQAATVRLLTLAQELAELSNSGQMAEIGFNVGGGEIVFKRILLPGNYQPPADQPIEPLVYLGSKMPNIFVEAWDKLKVGDYDRDWDERVREQLAGNSRDMDKRIVYQMINGEKWVEWNGVKMWAGLLSDRRDIGRFLAEESALATLKPGEFMVAKYSHGGGGAISAATAQQRKMDKPQIVGDVQMMGENGIIYQAAVEGEIDQIDALINGLVGQLHRDQNLSLSETITSVKPWLAGLPILPLATYPAKFLLRNEIPIGLKPETLPLTVDAWVTESVVAVTPPIFDLTQDIYLWAANDVEFIDFDLGFDAEDNSGNTVAVFDWPEPDNGPDGDDGGWDSGFVRPPEPIPGGGGGAKLPMVTSRLEPEVKKDKPNAAVSELSKPVIRDEEAAASEEKKPLKMTRETVFVDRKQGKIVREVTQVHRVIVRAKKDKPNAAVYELSSMVYMRRQQRKISGTMPLLSSKTDAVLPPVWQPDILPFNEKEVSPFDLAQWVSGGQQDFTIFIIARYYAILYTILVHLSDDRGSGSPRPRVVIYAS